MKKLILIVAALFIATTLHAEPALIKVSTPAFKDGERIPVEYTCDGKDLSPELIFVYKGQARSIAVTCTDPDAPGGTFVHWVLYGIQANITSLAKGFNPEGKSNEGMNDFGKKGYNGPCPPPGKPHRYYFTVYALDFVPDRPGMGYVELMKAIRGRVVAKGQVMGKYGR
jgi:Raf kinase inhibitor-like YbhB/YbcL family protein